MAATSPVVPGKWQGRVGSGNAAGRLRNASDSD